MTTEQQETPEQQLRRVNLERATLRTRVNELEKILAAWRPLLRAVGVDMDLGPERAGELLAAASEALSELPKLRARLEGYEAHMRYVVREGSSTGHCCFEATVRDTEADENLCETWEVADAHRIAASLNLVQKKTTDAKGSG